MQQAACGFWKFLWTRKVVSWWTKTTISLWLRRYLVLNLFYLNTTSLKLAKVGNALNFPGWKCPFVLRCIQLLHSDVSFLKKAVSSFCWTIQQNSTKLRLKKNTKKNNIAIRLWLKRLLWYKLSYWHKPGHRHLLYSLHFYANFETHNALWLSLAGTNLLKTCFLVPPSPPTEHQKRFLYIIKLLSHHKTRLATLKTKSGVVINLKSCLIHTGAD